MDAGGTFTDLVVARAGAEMQLFKSPTTPRDPIEGLMNVLGLAADQNGITRRELLTETDLMLHATTRATNALIDGSTARTALITTQGHRDVLLFREGGRGHAFDFSREYPGPYIPRSLTFEVPERIAATGDVIVPLDEAVAVEQLQRIAELHVEAVAVCFLWSPVNPVHEQRVGELIAQELPGLPHTLSAELNPTIREFRRASSACIDASLKPLMDSYLGELAQRLRSEGFGGRLLTVTSSGGVMRTERLAEVPIHSVGSGPSLAPVAGRYFAAADGAEQEANEQVIVADTGGTSYDVSLVRGGRIPSTRETWLGEPFHSPMTGFSSVDVKSIGSGGGSIAWVDEGGLLRVGPQSAGSDPGPACYRRGGKLPTVTDAAVALGYIDPAYFLGGAMQLDSEAALEALEGGVAQNLGTSGIEAAAAIFALVREDMVRAIEDLALKQGIDPASATLVAGGGAAGLNAVSVAGRLGCREVLIPGAAPALSAAGALIADLQAEYVSTAFASTARFDRDLVNGILGRLGESAQQFLEAEAARATATNIELFAEGRYPNQIWDLEVPVESDQLSNQEDVNKLRNGFHREHERVYAVSDRNSEVEFTSWHARASARLQDVAPLTLAATQGSRERSERDAYVEGQGMVRTPVHPLASLEVNDGIRGPAVIEAEMTSIVLPVGAEAQRAASGGVRVTPGRPNT